MSYFDLLYNKEIYRSDLELLNTSLFCRLTSSVRIMPDFFIGGVQKGGTTSLYVALTQHPQIIPGKFKEVFYYGNSDNYKKGVNFYKQFFATSFHKNSKEKKLGKHCLTLDASTNTFESTESPQRILNDNSNAKIVFILRNPVERAYSHYRMNHGRGWDKADFTTALELEDKRIEEGETEAIKYSGHNYAFQRLGYRSRGVYVNYLKNWYSHFPKENILVTSSESFFANPQHVYDSICEFLEIGKIENMKFEKLNEGKREDKMDWKAAEFLTNFYKPYNEELFTLLKKRYDW